MFFHLTQPVFRDVFLNMQSIFMPNLYVGDKADDEVVSFEELMKNHLRLVEKHKQLVF